MSSNSDPNPDHNPGGGGGTPEISSDRDGQRIFLGLKFSILGFFR